MRVFIQPQPLRPSVAQLSDLLVEGRERRHLASGRGDSGQTGLPAGGEDDRPVRAPAGAPAELDVRQGDRGAASHRDLLHLGASDVSKPLAVRGEEGMVGALAR